MLHYGFAAPHHSTSAITHQRYNNIKSPVRSTQFRIDSTTDHARLSRTNTTTGGHVQSSIISTVTTLHQTTVDRLKNTTTHQYTKYNQKTSRSPGARLVEKFHIKEPTSTSLPASLADESSTSANNSEAIVSSQLESVECQVVSQNKVHKRTVTVPTPVTAHSSSSETVVNEQEQWKTPTQFVLPLRLKTNRINDNNSSYEEVTISLKQQRRNKLAEQSSDTTNKPGGQCIPASESLECLPQVDKVSTETTFGRRPEDSQSNHQSVSQDRVTINENIEQSNSLILPENSVYNNNNETKVKLRNKKTTREKVGEIQVNKLKIEKVNVVESGGADIKSLLKITTKDVGSDNVINKTAVLSSRPGLLTKSEENNIPTLDNDSVHKENIITSIQTINRLPSTSVTGTDHVKPPPTNENNSTNTEYAAESLRKLDNTINKSEITKNIRSSHKENAVTISSNSDKRTENKPKTLHYSKLNSYNKKSEYLIEDSRKTDENIKTTNSFDKEVKIKINEKKPTFERLLPITVDAAVKPSTVIKLSVVRDDSEKKLIKSNCNEINNIDKNDKLHTDCDVNSDPKSVLNWVVARSCSLTENKNTNTTLVKQSNELGSCIENKVNSILASESSDLKNSQEDAINVRSFNVRRELEKAESVLAKEASSVGKQSELRDESLVDKISSVHEHLEISEIKREVNNIEVKVESEQVDRANNSGEINQVPESNKKKRLIKGTRISDGVKEAESKVKTKSASTREKTKKKNSSDSKAKKKQCSETKKGKSKSLVKKIVSSVKEEARKLTKSSTIRYHDDSEDEGLGVDYCSLQTSSDGSYNSLDSDYEIIEIEVMEGGVIKKKLIVKKKKGAKVSVKPVTLKPPPIVEDEAKSGQITRRLSQKRVSLIDEDLGFLEDRKPSMCTEIIEEQAAVLDHMICEELKATDRRKSSLGLAAINVEFAAKPSPTMQDRRREIWKNKLRTSGKSLGKFFKPIVVEESSSEESDDEECDVNCHRKCQRLMPNLCGVNHKLVAEALLKLKKTRRSGRSNQSTSSASSFLDSDGTVSTSLSSISITNSSENESATEGASGRITPPAKTLPKFRTYSIQDFQFLKVLGKGSFGKVLLAELRGSECYYAVKCLKKDVVLEDDDVECTMIERKVLALGTGHPYFCHLFCTFQTQSHLFFVMEYLNGGDLMFHIQQSGRFDEGRARFYAAEIVCGLTFLHKWGIVYRDLKLDNVLLDFDGHVRIADFGMCKLQIYLDKTTDTFCGTPDYMAPEVLKGQKYNQCVDWWSFGILLYEMLVGQSPFSGCDEDDLFWSICNMRPHFPRHLSNEAKSILNGFLEKDWTKRLGSSQNGASDVMNHEFFTGLKWHLLERRQLDPPFKPNMKHPLDTKYFDRAFTSEKPILTPVDKSILESMDQTQFQGFSYTNPNATE